MIKTKLVFMPYAQATVFHYNDIIVLRSYKTDVASLDKDGWLIVNGLYSMTTRRHISAFLQEYTNVNFSTAKFIVENKVKYNIFTGEIVDL